MRRRSPRSWPANPRDVAKTARGPCAILNCERYTVRMANGNYYDDRRFCASCATYVPFLMSPHASYCARCGERVALFSPDDMSRFRSSAGAASAPVTPPGSLAVQLMAKKRGAVNRASAKPAHIERAPGPRATRSAVRLVSDGSRRRR